MMTTYDEVTPDKVQYRFEHDGMYIHLDFDNDIASKITFGVTFIMLLGDTMYKKEYKKGYGKRTFNAKVMDRFDKGFNKAFTPKIEDTTELMCWVVIDISYSTFIKTLKFSLFLKDGYINAPENK